MELEAIFESLDKEVFTPEVQEMLKESIAKSLEEKEAELKEAFAGEFETYRSEMEDRFKSYSEFVAEGLVKDYAEKLDSMVESSKLEAFSVEMKTIAEAFGLKLEAEKCEDEEEKKEEEEEEDEKKEEKETNESQVKALNDTIDRLMAEKIELQGKLEKISASVARKEISEGLTLVQEEKFAKLAEMAEFKDIESYTEQLKVIKESLLTVPEAKEEPVTESVTQGYKW